MEDRAAELRHLDMYTTYELARAHEQELMRLAQANRVELPRPERRRIRLSIGLSSLLRRQRATALAKPAFGQ
jgi:hypothetical protein